MGQAVELRVRTIIADTLRALPENIRPETLLLGGVVPFGRMMLIAHRVERAFDLDLFTIAQVEAWSSAGDIIAATEKALAAATRGEAA